MVVLVGVAFVGGLTTTLSLPVFSLEEVSVARVVTATIGCVLLASVHGSVAYAAAGFGASRGLSAGIGIVVLVVGYLMSFVLPLADALAGTRDWSPWYWALGDQPISDGVDLWRLALAGVMTGVLTAVGTWAVDRRDIRTA